MIRKYLIVALCLFGVNRAFGQRNMDLFPVIDDSIKIKLYDFARQESKFKVNAGMYIFNILENISPSNKGLPYGIYKFRLMGSHLQTYLFIYTSKNGLQIIKDYSVENVISKLESYFKYSGATFSEEKKLDYMESVIGELRQRQHIPGSEPLPPRAMQR